MRRHALLFPALLLLACSDPAPEAASTTTRNVAVGQAVPAYAAASLAGDTVSLESLRGNAVVLNIWATWCPPCREEMPSLQRLHRDLAPRGLRVIAVSVDNDAARSAVETFVRDYALDFTILHDPAERISRTFRTIGVPETFLIDADGKLVRRWIGEVDADSEEFRKAVLDVL